MLNGGGKCNFFGAVATSPLPVLLQTAPHSSVAISNPTSIRWVTKKAQEWKGDQRELQGREKVPVGNMIEIHHAYVFKCHRNTLV